VRALGRILGIDEDIVMRHPFPGPGLAVRILGEVTREKCDILRDADDIYIRELKRRGFYNQISRPSQSSSPSAPLVLPAMSVNMAGYLRSGPSSAKTE